MSRYEFLYSRSIQVGLKRVLFRTRACRLPFCGPCRQLSESTSKILHRSKAFSDDSGASDPALPNERCPMPNTTADRQATRRSPTTLRTSMGESPSQQYEHNLHLHSALAQELGKRVDSTSSGGCLFTAHSIRDPCTQQRQRDRTFKAGPSK